MVRQDKVRQDKIDRVEEVKTIFEVAEDLFYGLLAWIKAEDSRKNKKQAC